MSIRIFFLFLFSSVVSAKTIELPLDLKLDIRGYAGYKYIGGTAKTSFLPSSPELGAVLNLQVNKNLSFYNQFVYSQQKNTMSTDGSLVYSFAALDFNIVKDLNATIRAGRLRHDVGLYNNTRVNPRTRQGVIMPQSIYWDSLNLIMTSGDGINGSIKYKGFELNYTMDAPLVANKTTEANVWAPHILNSINTSFGSHQLVSVAYDFDSIPLRIKSDWSKIDLGSDYTAPFKYYYPNMTKGSQGAEMVTSGIEYKGENFVLAAESTMVKPSYMKWSQVGEFYKGYSLTGSYEFTDNITGRINYNEYNNKSDLLKGLPDHYMYAKDINVGVNYHKDNWQVGAEVHKINGGRWLNQQEFLANPSSYKEWYMVGINIVYFFD